jgi:hypothetical protein
MAGPIVYGTTDRGYGSNERFSMRIVVLALVATGLAACVSTPTRVAVTTPAVVAPPPAQSAPAAKRIAYTGTGSYILPDGTVVAADPGGGFTLPNGARVSADGAGGVVLPNGARCTSDGQSGYICP